MSAVLDHLKLYRLPWSLPDNAISWMEPTRSCNLHCEGCYRENEAGGHKTLEEVKEELALLGRLRKSDSITLAGGDPLTHPKICEVVQLIAQEGYKPVMNTNGLALTRDILVDLKKAGLTGLVIHVDSKQGRPGWKGKDELELCALRTELAEMVANVGGLSCGFICTIFSETEKHVPEIVRWAAQHIDIVQVLALILYRQASLAGHDYYVGGRRIDMSELVYSTTSTPQRALTTQDIVSRIREVLPEFEACAYLNGTEKPDSFKWLLTCRIGTRERVFGYCGPKFIELAQTLYHLSTGRYLSHLSPETAKKSKWTLLLAPIDAGLRRAAIGYARAAIARPLELTKDLHLQSIVITQPIDILDGGGRDMCDGCPDAMVYNGRLVWSCRMEELSRFGRFVTTVPREDQRR